MPTLEALDICPVLYHWPILISVRANSLSLFNFVNENYFFLRNNFDDLAAFLWYMHLYITNVLKENFYIWDINQFCWCSAIRMLDCILHHSFKTEHFLNLTGIDLIQLFIIHVILFWLLTWNGFSISFCQFSQYNWGTVSYPPIQLT